MRVSRNLVVPDEEMELVAVRSQGPGGQHVNKASTAIQLFFNIRQSSLPEHCKSRLLHLRDRRITGDGVVVIKAQSHRSQEQNKIEAMKRLAGLIRSVLASPKKRKATRPGRAARQKRLDSKKRQGRTKVLRRRVNPE